jgi:hypothetical protein
LAGGKDLSSGLKKYLLGVGMLGAISQGKREEAARLWSEYGAALFDAGNEPTLLFRMLAAESFSP